MGLLGRLGEIIQKALFTTRFSDIVESLDNVRARIEELDARLQREVKSLEQQIKDTEARLESRRDEV